MKKLNQSYPRKLTLQPGTLLYREESKLSMAMTREEKSSSILASAVDLGTINSHSITQWSGDLGEDEERFFKFEVSDPTIDLYVTISELNTDLDLYFTDPSLLYLDPVKGRAGKHLHLESSTNRGTGIDQLFLRIDGSSDPKEYVLRVANNLLINDGENNQFKLELDTKTFPDTTIFPNDPYLIEQWYIFNNSQVEFKDARFNPQLTSRLNVDIAGPEAWKKIHDASDIIVAVIDTGVDYTHPDLINNIWVNTNDPINGIDDDGNGYKDDYYGWDFFNNDNDPTDDSGHGTHVAGTIGAEGNNELGVSGIAWRTQIMPIKALRGKNSSVKKTTKESMEGIANSIHYAVDQGADVINMSLSMRVKDLPEAVLESGEYQLFRDALMKAHENDVFVTLTSGNTRSDIYATNKWNDISNIDQTSSIPNLFGQELGNIAVVSASNARGALASYSSGGLNANIAAPGGDKSFQIPIEFDDEGVPTKYESISRAILSTVPTGTSTWKQSADYGFKAGTSMAAPIIAGAAALIRAANIDITAPETLAIIRRSAFVYPELNNMVDGNLSLNLNGAVEEALSWEGITNFIGHQLPDSPVLDFSAFTDAHTVQAKLNLKSNADLSIEMGFFRVNDIVGTIMDPSGLQIQPGDEGYRELALSSINTVDSLSGMSIKDNENITINATLAETTYLSPYVIAGNQVFFAFDAANADGLTHIRNDGLNGFLVEDTFGGGDGSFDDLQIRVTFSDLN